VALIDPLKEIQTHDPEVEEVLSSEYKYILANAEKLKSLLKRQPSYLNRLYGNLLTHANLTALLTTHGLHAFVKAIVAKYLILPLFF